MKLRSWKTAFTVVSCIQGTSILLYALIGVPILTKLCVSFLLHKQSFRLSDGDVVHCIPIQNLTQKLSAPALTWRTTPSMEPLGSRFSDLSMTSAIKDATQLIAVEKRFCPIGTVPMRSRSDSTYFSKILGREAYPRMNPVVHLLLVDHQAQKSAPVDSALWSTDLNDTHKYAVTDVVGPYRGTQGRLSIWQPHVQEEEFSLAQVWVSSIDNNGRVHSLEAGWQIYRGLYSDSKPRLFVYWTADRYITTGCYNLDCPGFIQVSNKWLLGGSFAAVSAVESDFQYEIKIQIFKDRGTADWWLQLNNDNVGYWPQSLFGPGAFSDSNTRIHWGGEIFHRPFHYTDTQMGNGNRPSPSGYYRVAYVRNLQVVNCEDNLRDFPRTLTSLATHRECCDIKVYGSWDNLSHRSSWGTFAHFGGPGFNAECVGEKPVQPA